jgi:catechol 2,3-dioxygenase-like lactoylglutathione lyase family enzyme
MTVSDLDRSVSFYTDVLGFEKVDETEVAGRQYEDLEGVFGLRARRARLRLGDEQIELTEYLAPPGGRAVPLDTRGNDRWFQHIAIVVSDMDAAYARLRQHKVQHVSTNPQTIPLSNPAAGGIRAFYFRDPDGHTLELIYFPAGKGDPKWLQPTDNLFLGIDHTAITVADTAASLRFYRDLLGLHVAGESLNHGTEQEHLANVRGARVRITGLRTAGGGAPGIEFLDYQAPRDGRPFPDDTRANDLTHWQTTLVVDDVDTAARRLQAAKFKLLSAQPVILPDGALGFTKGVVVRDPDGHAVQLVEH